MNKRRLFIAINLPDGIKKKLSEWRSKWADLDRAFINWVRRENLHVTLIFIGYVGEDETYEVCKTVRETAKNHQPFYIRLERIITGPPNSTPRMFWAEGEKSQELADLQNDLENALSMGTGYKKEIRPFSPHITLARFKYQIAKDLPKINDEFKNEVLVETIEVMQSELRRTGPEYTILESVNLGEA